MLNTLVLLMGSRGVVVFGLGAAAGLGTAFLLLDGWRRQRNPNELPPPNEQLQGTITSPGSKYFK